MHDEDVQAELECLRQESNLVKAAIAALTRVPHFSKQYEKRSLCLANGIVKMSEVNLPQLDTPLNVALCGQFSSGKSSLINALLGDSYCPTQHSVTTKQCTCFVYGEKETISDADGRGWTKEAYQQRVKAEEGCEFTISLPFEMLKLVHIWDVPGLNAPNSDGESDEQKSNRICSKADCIVYLTDSNGLEEKDKKTLDQMAEKDVIVVLPKCDRDADAGQRYKKLCGDLAERGNIAKVIACGGFNPKNSNDKMKESSVRRLKGALLRLQENGQKRRRLARRSIFADLSRMAQACQKDILWLNERSAEWRHLIDQEKTRFHEVAGKLNDEDAVEVAHDILEEECVTLIRNVVAKADELVKTEKVRWVVKKASVRDVGLVSTFHGIKDHIVGRICHELHVDELPAVNADAGKIVKSECDSIMSLLEDSFQQFENEANWESHETSCWTTKLLEEGKKALTQWCKNKSCKLKKKLKDDTIKSHLKSLVDGLVCLAEAQSASRRRNIAQLVFFENTLAGAGMLLEELKGLKGA